MSNLSHQTDRPQRLGRPRKSPDELRTAEVRTFLTIAEKQKLSDDAATAGMRPAEYVRQLIAGHRPKAMATKSCDPRLLLELNAIGNNLNQAVRDMHAGSERKHDWEQLRDLLEAVLEKVVSGDVC